jgi:hypothetical protein
MKKLIGLTVCLGLMLVVSGCGGKSEPAKSNPSPAPSSPAPSPTPSPPPQATSSNAGDEAGAAQAKAEAKPKVDPFDDHSDDPWFDGEAVGTPGAGGQGDPLTALLSGLLPTPTAKPGAGGEKKPGGAAGSWEPDKALLDQLEPYQDVEGYQIRLPKGYNPMQMPITPPAGTRFLSWLGPKHNGSACVVQGVLSTIPAGETKNNLTNAIAGAENTLKAQWRDWQQTPPEKGQVNGLSFLRVRNQGVIAQMGALMGKKVRGFLYAAQDGPTQILLTGLCAEEDAEALKLAEAAVLTFRKK